MRRRWEQWLAGWVAVTVRGGRRGPILTELLAHGHHIWGVRTRPGALDLVVGWEAVPTLRQMARRYRLTVRFGARGGWPRWRRALVRRPVLLLGVLGLGLWLQFFGGRVWLVDIPAAGLDLAQRRAVIAAAAAVGLSAGQPNDPAYLQVVRRRLQAALPQFAWIGLERQGVVVRIAAVPLLRRPPPATAPYLVATAGGTVRQVVVFIGRSLVHVGQSVRPGQPLIAGAVVAEGPEGPGQPAREVATPAAGEVWADVTYRETVRQPLRLEEAVVGRTIRVVRWLDGSGRVWWQVGPDRPPFAHWRVTVVRQPLYYRDVLLPFEREEIVYNEMISRVRRLDVQGAAALARAKAEAELRARLPQGATVVRQAETVRRVPEGVEVSLVFTVRQNIAGPPAANSGSGASGSPAPTR
ncbi:MAG: sporulation protein YqfD [Firmicutes bacterium]|nr:sporulation protein YqfD [Alicyclobacillaceae bacterium]MCL6496937.1 sporulation protein YqfD [Bacillota bacterium]